MQDSRAWANESEFTKESKVNLVWQSFFFLSEQAKEEKSVKDC